MSGVEAWELESRRYSVCEGGPNPRGGLPPPSLGMVPSTSEDLHAWSIYRQNLNSDFTDSALGSSEKSPLPYGNFQLRESTVQSILSHPRYGPKSALGSNMYTYLKFGLPRVLPPRRKDASSGYDSSDEGAPRRMRARSEADLHNLHFQPSLGVAGCRGKSVSQANLLAVDTLIRRTEASHRQSLHDLRHPSLHQPPLLRASSGHVASHRASVMSSQPRALSSVVPPEPFSFSTLHPQQYTGLYPHLQLRNMTIRGRRGEPLVNNLSMEVKAGEILSIMSTNSSVATGVLSVIAGVGRGSGHISLNGQVVSPSDLRRLVAFVRTDTVLHPDLHVHNCLRFYAKLRRPHKSRANIPMEEQVRIVTEELGLSPVLDTKVTDLTRSEYSRLLVALQLLADSPLLAIDHVTGPMDIFDTFFLVEFLRQWASGATGGVTGRIVVMALQPPTYEILTMVSRLLVLSGGETMYHGPSRALPAYFTSADYPCPAFKNPADYYLDLVTLDDLSAEAMLESSQRVDQLAGVQRRRQSPLVEAAPAPLPPGFRPRGLLPQAAALLLRELVYSQPTSFCRWMGRLLTALLMSLILGAVFWDVPATDPYLAKEDRLGFHSAVMLLASWPLLLTLALSKSHGVLREAAESDIRQGLYSRLIYIITSILVMAIPSALVWVAYLLPAYCMSGLYEQATSDGLTVYLSYSLVGLLCLESVVLVCGSLSGGRLASVLVSLVLMLGLASAPGGLLLHAQDALLPPHYAPLAELLAASLRREHSPDTLAALTSHLICRNKPMERQDIIVQVACPVANGSAVLARHGVSPVTSHDYWSPFAQPLVYSVAACLLTIIAFSLSPTHKGRRPV